MKKEKKSEKIDFWIRKSLKDKLIKLAGQHDRSVGYIVHRILETFIDKYK